MSGNMDYEARILAYIAPRVPETAVQEAAVAAAATAQEEYETMVAGALGSYGGIEGIASISNAGVAVGFSAAKPRAGESIAPRAREALLSAGLLTGYMPQARRLP